MLLLFTLFQSHFRRGRAKPKAKKGKAVTRGPAWNSSEETRDRFLPSWSEDKGRSGSSKNGSEEEKRIIWEYSKDALQLVQLYHRRFPRVFHALNADGYKKLGTRDVCANDEEFDQLCLWLQQLPRHCFLSEFVLAHQQHEAVS